MFNSEKVLHKCEGNPIITPESFPNGYAMIDCAQTMYNDKYLLLITIQTTDKAAPAIFVAESVDGEHFDIHPEPLITSSEKYKELDKYVSSPYISYVPEDDMYYITRPLLKNPWGISNLLARTKDFKTVEDMGIVALPHSNANCLFQGKVNGRYARLDRPNTDGCVSPFWISYSDDLKYWGEHKPLIQPYAVWNSQAICPTPPIKTKDGWLCIYHGTKEGRVSLGAILFDLDDPSKIKGKTKNPILTATDLYECFGLTRLESVSTCGAIVDEEKDEIRIYYSGARMSIGLATGKLSELLKLMI